MAADENLQYILSTALQVGDFNTALPWLETFSRDQISELALPDQHTPLHYACQHGRVDVAQCLITNCKCSIESRDAQGCTPLHTAAQYGQVETLKYLLHRLFDYEVSGLTAKPDGKLSHTLTSMFQYKLSDRHRNQSGNTPLHTACVHGQLDTVQLLTCEIGCDPNNTNNEGLSCLHLAAQHGHLPLVRYLVESDVTLEDEHGRSPTYLAAGGGHLDILKYLIETKGADPQFKTSKGWKTAQFTMVPGRSLVHTASREGHLDVVRYLVEQPHGCDPSCSDTKGWTPLHLACQQGHIDIVSYLITEGHCDPLCPNKNKQTPLHKAAANGQLEVVRYFAITHLSNLLIKDMFSNTPLHLAAFEGQLEVVKFVTEDMKCDPNLKGQYERTPLHHASAGGHLEVVKYLVDGCHCDPLCPDEHKQTPLHRAAANGHLEVVRYFAITYGNLLVRNKFNSTALHLAALEGQLEVVKFFIEDMKCNPILKGEYERTPLHYASERGHFDIVKFLVDACHCDPLCLDEDKRTPLHMAASHGHLEVVRYFAITHLSNFLVKDMFSNTPLHLAALEGQLEVVKFVIEDVKCDPNLEGQYERTPLHLASAGGHLEVVEYLVDECYCHPLCPDYVKQTPILLAAARGQLKVVRYFEQLLGKNNINTALLHHAVLNNQLDIIKYLVECYRLDEPGRKKILKTTNNSAVLEFMKAYIDPLHHAAITGDMDSVRHYIERKQWCPKMLDRHGNNTLHNAAQYGQLEVVQYLTGLNKDPINEVVEILCDPLVKNKYGLMAQDIASQNGHRHVVSYLLRATSNQPVLQQDIIQPPVTIFVIGNSESGKSTLIKALTSNSRHRLGRIIKVKGVMPLTAGIVPSTLHSQMFGKVTIYDFAGHEEYYASHEMVLCQTTQPIVLLAVNISLSEQDIKKQLSYWLMILSNCSFAHVVKTMHAIIIGSHADQIKFGERRKIYQLVESLQSSALHLRYHGFIQCDCRYPISDNLNQLRLKLGTICKSIRLFFAQESYDSNRLCASLMYHLECMKSEQAVITVNEVFRSIPHHLNLALFADQELLLETCEHLSSNGHFLFFRHHESKFRSLLALNQGIVLPKFHAWFKVIQSSRDPDNKLMGIFEHSELKGILSELLDNITEPELAIKYAIFAQFCTKVSANQLISEPGNIQRAVYYVFPNLVSASRPADTLSTGKENYTHFYTWGLKCTDARHFFTPRFLHTLFIQLTKYERNTDNAKFSIWKSGIFMLHSNGTICIIELTDQTTRLYFMMQCLKGFEPYLLRWRSKLIHSIRSLANEVCPKVKTEEFLLLPQTTFPLVNCEEISIADVKLAVQSGHEIVHYSNGKVDLKDLLYLDSYHVTEDQKLYNIFSHCLSDDLVSLATLSSYCSSSELYREFAEIFDDIADQGLRSRDVTYSELHKELMKYSILADENVSTNVGRPIKKLVTSKGATVGNLSETGISLFIPADAISSEDEPLEFQVLPSIDCAIELPDGFVPASPVYFIKYKGDTQFQKKITVEIHHYIDVERMEGEDLVFMTSASREDSVHIFTKIEDEAHFEPKTQIGRVSLSHFSPLMIRDVKLCSARLYRKAHEHKAVLCMCLRQNLFTTMCDEKISEDYEGYATRGEHRSAVPVRFKSGVDEAQLHIDDSEEWNAVFDRDAKISKEEVYYYSNIHKKSKLKKESDFPPRVHIYNLLPKTPNHTTGQPKLKISGLEKPCSFVLIVNDDSADAVSPPTAIPTYTTVAVSSTHQMFTDPKVTCKFQAYVLALLPVPDLT